MNAQTATEQHLDLLRGYLRDERFGGQPPRNDGTGRLIALRLEDLLAAVGTAAWAHAVLQGGLTAVRTDRNLGGRSAIVICATHVTT